MLVPRAGSTIHCPEYESCARAWKIERLIVSKIAAATKADNLPTQTVNSFRAKLIFSCVSPVLFISNLPLFETSKMGLLVEAMYSQFNQLFN